MAAVSAAATVVAKATTVAAGTIVMSPLASGISWLATVLNIAMLSSPLLLVYRFVNYQMDPVEAGDLLTTDAGPKHQPTLMMVNGVSILTLLANVACCTGWVIYGLITGMGPVLLGNGLGLLVGMIGAAAYVYVYYAQLHQVKMQFGTLSPGNGGGPVNTAMHAPNHHNTPIHKAYQQALVALREMQTQVAIAATICVVLVWYYFERSYLALPFIRLFCGVSTIAMFAAPIAVIRKVITGNAIASIVFTWPNILFTFGNCVLWLTFGLLIGDFFAVAMPNIVGIVVSLAQASLLMRDRRHVVVGMSSKV